MLFSSQSPQGDALSLLLGLVPTLPTEVDVTSPEVGNARVLLASVDAGRLVAYGPQSLMQDGLTLALRVRDSSGGGTDFAVRVDRAYYQVGDQCMLHLVVDSAEERPGHREAPRYVLDDSAEAFVLESAKLQQQSVAVRLADLSETGFAFLTELECAAGDVIMLTFSIGERPITIQGRVRRVDAAPLRNRTACEISGMQEWDREAIGRLARIQEEMLARPDADRRPEVAQARTQSRREQHQLQVRMALRRLNES
ncbi:MAG: PilZ domain-containing protein [Gaiellales bacterium]